MDSNRDGERRSSTLHARLRREARSTRPGFSPAFHERLVKRVTREAVTSPDIVQPTLSMMMRRGRGPFVFSVTSAGFVAIVVAVLAVAWIPGKPQFLPRPLEDLNAGVLAATASGEITAGIEVIPLYDDIDAGVRAGAWKLASSLVEWPDWASLADFDATAILADASGP